jgi:alanyl-tRNA synthetase
VLSVWAIIRSSAAAHIWTHGQSGSFHIQSEFSVASGVRRIEADRRVRTLNYFKQNQQQAERSGRRAENKHVGPRPRAEQQAQELRELRREVESFKSKEATGGSRNLLRSAKSVGNLNVMTAQVKNATATVSADRRLSPRQDESCVAVLASVSGGKITFSPPKAVKRRSVSVKAGDLIRAGYENLRRLRRRQARFRNGRREKCAETGRSAFLG